jgi:two-component system nitrogen regulation response regulator GlnG/two-component system response regulator HydG
MSPESTSPESELPWDRPKPRDLERFPHLVFAWSLDEPERVGEVIPVTCPVCVGRGEALTDDPAPRVTPKRMRPAETRDAGAIVNARVSRLHLTVEPEGDAAVRIHAHGRAPMRINGRTTSEGVARDGDIVELHNAAVFLVVSRPETLQPLRSANTPDFAFGRADPFGITGESPVAWALRDALAFASTTDRHVLLVGESGVGKELAARSIHGLSSRRSSKIVSRNAATVPESLIDAELFGNTKNYPNPGMPERDGLIGEADGSTLFLDEIGELPESSQVHLLRVLDTDGEYQRLGDSKARRSSFRLVAATNRPLDSLKHDFLARFTHRITVPGLAERREDIPLLVGELLARIARDNAQLAGRFFERRRGERAEPKIAPDFVIRLLRHPFSHHVRELDRILWLAIGSAEDDYIGVTEAVDAELGPPGNPASGFTEIGREDLLQALRDHGRSPTRIAKALGVKNRYVLHRLLKKHGLTPGALDEGGTE